MGTLFYILSLLIAAWRGIYLPNLKGYSPSVPNLKGYYSEAPILKGYYSQTQRVFSHFQRLLFINSLIILVLPGGIHGFYTYGIYIYSYRYARGRARGPKGEGADCFVGRRGFCRRGDGGRRMLHSFQRGPPFSKVIPRHNNHIMLIY